MEPMIRLRNIEKCYKTKAVMTYVLRQITLDLHSETNAAYGDRIIKLQDGWLAKE